MFKQAAILLAISCMTLTGCNTVGSTYITPEVAKTMTTRELCLEYGWAFEAASSDLDNILNEMNTRTDISASMCKSLVWKAQESYNQGINLIK